MLNNGIAPDYGLTRRLDDHRVQSNGLPDHGSVAIAILAPQKHRTLAFQYVVSHSGLREH